MSDNVWPNKPSGPNENETRNQAENKDRASLQNELREQERLGDEMFNPFDANRVEYPGSGDGAGGRVRRNSWPK